ARFSHGSSANEKSNADRRHPQPHGPRLGEVHGRYNGQSQHNVASRLNPVKDEEIQLSAKNANSNIPPFPMVSTNGPLLRPNCIPTAGSRIYFGNMRPVN